VHAPDKQLGFYLDISGLSVINLSSNVVQHLADVPTNIPRIGVQLQYLQGLGPAGALALIGGASLLENQTEGTLAFELVSYCC
jgi:hypothetical protein